MALHGVGRRWIRFELWLSVTSQSFSRLHAALALEQLEIRMMLIDMMLLGHVSKT